MRCAPALPCLLLLVGRPVGAWGQSPSRVQVAAQAVAVFHRVDPTAEARSATRFQITQPVITATIRFGGGFGGRATLDLEGLTIPDGELTPGAWGEGFVDRRHPHTYAHEIIIDGARSFRCLAALLCRVGGFLGKGFVPFGSADPMARPFARYPVNHHLAQILERAVVAAQVEIGPARLEGSIFNGDEPETPGQWPRVAGRFGDSWSLRATLRRRDQIELAASIASVQSPEHRPGAGSRQQKRHVGAVVRPAADRIRFFAEWARTSELGGFFVFDSWLGEGRWRGPGFDIQYRFEATDRPEEERISPFRSLRPHLENSILGVTRWTSHTVGATVPIRRFRGRGCLTGFAEATAGRVRSTPNAAFDALATYGKAEFTSLSVGLKLAWGAHPAMGQYGLARDDGGHAHAC